jgi:hypothetical protein
VITEASREQGPNRGSYRRGGGRHCLLITGDEPLLVQITHCLLPIRLKLDRVGREADRAAPVVAPLLLGLLMPEVLPAHLPSAPSGHPMIPLAHLAKRLTDLHQLLAGLGAIAVVAERPRICTSGTTSPLLSTPDWNPGATAHAHELSRSFSCLMVWLHWSSTRRKASPCRRSPLACPFIALGGVAVCG